MSVKALASQLLAILEKDRDRLERLDDYIQGDHDDPYMPASADAEYKMLAKRAVSNWMPLLISTPSQAMYVDGFRRGSAAVGGNATAKEIGGDAPEWDHWQYSRLDARQVAIYRGALGYGHSFTLTERDKKGKVVTKGLSARNTAALYEDAANDETPYAALTVVAWPKAGGKKLGKARMWTDLWEFEVIFRSLMDVKRISVRPIKRHGASENPVTRFSASVDLEGRTMGVVEPMIPLQNRINQTVFDLLVAQTYGSFQVRWVTGMAPPMQQRAVYSYDTNGDPVYNKPTNTAIPVEYEPVLDEQGQPVAKDIRANASRFMFAQDHEAKFGTLSATPLGGYIESIDQSIRHLAAVTQTPPHHLLGQIANLSAEALNAAETSLARKIEEFKQSFGESWERVFRLAAELEGNEASAADYHGEVIWRDMESRSLAQSADALGKMHEQLGIPQEGLWKRVPGVTQNELSDWADLKKEEDKAGKMADALNRAAPTRSTAPVPGPNSVGELP